MGSEKQTHILTKRKLDFLTQNRQTNIKYQTDKNYHVV